MSFFIPVSVSIILYSRWATMLSTVLMVLSFLRRQQKRIHEPPSFTEGASQRSGLNLNRPHVCDDSDEQ